jgi:hypothetical protein
LKKLKKGSKISHFCIHLYGLLSNELFSEIKGLVWVWLEPRLARALAKSTKSSGFARAPFLGARSTTTLNGTMGVEASGGSIQ